MEAAETDWLWPLLEPTREKGRGLCGCPPGWG